MNKKVTLTELMLETIVVVLNLTVYYWCWARTDWKPIYATIQNCMACFTAAFFVLMAARIKRYNKEDSDEMATANLKRCDSICLKILVVVMVATAFVSGAMGHVNPNMGGITGWAIMIAIDVIAIFRVVLFTVMDKKGI